MRPERVGRISGAILLAWAALLPGARAAEIAPYWDGERLYENCTRGDVPVCVGYLMAILDASNGKEFGPLSLKGFSDFYPHYCFPDGEDVGTALDAVVAYLRAHPERLHESAATLVIAALARAFPCGYPLGRRPSSPAR